MDPMSAIGFGAALVQLTANIVQCCKTLNDARRAFKHAPQDIERLYKALRRLRWLIDSIRELGDGIDDCLKPSQLGILWKEHAVEIETDVKDLTAKVTSLGKLSNKSMLSANDIRIKIKKVFMKDELERYERSISRHQEVFSLIFGMLSELRNRSIYRHMKLQSREIRELQKTTARAAEGSVFLYEKIGSKSFHLPQPSCRALSAQLSRKLNVTTDFDPQAPVMNLVKEVVSESENLRIVPDNDSIQKPWAQSRVPRFAELALCTTASGPNSPPRHPMLRYFITSTTFGCRFPLGFVTGREVTKNTVASRNSGDDHRIWSLDVTLFPFSWLSRMTIWISIQTSTSSAFKFSLRTRYYTDSTKLREALNCGDIDGIKTIFSDREATPECLMALSGNSLLHEAINRHVAGIPNMLELCNLLLTCPLYNTNPNVVNKQSRSALTHCCRLMRWACSSSETLMPILNILVQNGADITLQDEEGLSAISYMLDARQGHRVSYAQADSGDLQALLDMLDLDVFEDMNSLDFWLVATYASSTMPSIRSKLESQLRERRTPTEISSSIRPIQETLPELYIEEQLKWIKTATVSERVRFIRSLCAHCDEDTIRPFLECGIDVNETEPGYDLATYMRAAAEQGKVGTMKTLLESGASVDCDDAFLGFDEMCTSAVDDLVIRWHRRMSGKSPWVSAPTPVDDEYWIMPLLFRKQKSIKTNALISTVQSDMHPSIVNMLIQCGCGRRDGQAAMTGYQWKCGSEVIEAVKGNSRHLQTFLDAGLGLECEDFLGRTAMLYAIEKASSQSVKALLEAGADVERRTSFGITALELAESNVRASHPRRIRKDWSQNWSQYLSHEQHPVISLQSDLEIYEALLSASAPESRRTKLPYLMFPERWRLSISFLEIRVIKSGLRVRAAIRKGVLLLSAFSITSLAFFMLLIGRLVITMSVDNRAFMFYHPGTSAALVLERQLPKAVVQMG
ncbi:hypothetical protein F5Y14DRAFT_453747 [Nemania sp. NC0429]|nr:hypothetical protein F5Y14DRAFT_453747 [Nemania sp. NC0429]